MFAELNKGTLLFFHYFFLVFHTTFTLFNLFGWMWKATRRVHIITIGATAFSWLFLGIWYGLGYCFCTDWHWQVMAELGINPGTNSYIHYLVREVSGLDPGYGVTIEFTRWIFISVVLLSIGLNIADVLSNRRQKGSGVESDDYV